VVDAWKIKDLDEGGDDRMGFVGGSFWKDAGVMVDVGLIAGRKHLENHVNGVLERRT
jgi:hypothetical protein